MSTSNVLRPGGRSRPGRLLALLTATAVAASLLSAPSGQALANGSSAPATAPDAARFAPTEAEPVAVTLITGDTVYWQDNGDGSPQLEVELAQRDHAVEFEQSGTQEDFYVIPSDAIPQVMAGTLDEELFNVPGLIRQGLDDATTDELPVIVTFDHDRNAERLAQDASTLPAVGDATAVKRLNGAGVAVNRSKAAEFRQAVLGKPERGGSPRTAGARGLDGPVEKVLLDRTLEIDLADSVRQIGAPEAWDAGFTGEGIVVAVLDTGIDSNHPDLEGKVVAEANFTDEPDATDTHGHGTHVASTIAGTGAASDGARTGVAPGAELLNGKVCRPTPDGQGVCQTSWIMAGMEWAAAQGADVVNMSLGGDPTNGTDPLSQLLNQLSAETGTLFVTSAGNNGPRGQTVGTPGAADAALAVGAVDKSDQLARFSSRGPRLGDHAVKPEITAPGVDIAAARAQGTSAGSPVDDHYTSLNGTSMASPHVAGAAALLAQAQPDLGWAELKDALVSTATDIGELYWEQGLGRVNVPAALDSPIHATGTANLGHVTDQAEHDITYTNHSDADITLDLDVAITDDRGQATGVASLSADTLAVPAGGQATATITVDITGVPDGQNLFGGGVVTATGEGVSLRTGIGFGPVRHVVKIEVLDSQGDLVGTPGVDDTRVHLDHDTYDPDNPVGNLDYRFSTTGGIATGHLPSGTYSLKTVVEEDDPVTGERIRGNVLVAVDVVIDADTTITLDARDAVPVRVSVPREAEQRNHMVSLVRQRLNIHPEATTTLRAGGANRPMYVTPTPPSEFGFLALVVNWVLAEPQPVHPLPWSSLCTDPRFQLPFWCYSEAPAYAYNLPFVYKNGIPDDLHERVTRHDLVEVPTQFHSDQSDDVFVLHQFESFTAFPCGFGCGGTQTAMWIKPGKVVEYFLADDSLTWTRHAFPHHRPQESSAGLAGGISSDWFPTAEAGTKRAEEHWGEAPLRIGAVDIREDFFHAPNTFERLATASRGGVNGNQFIPGYQVMDNTRGHHVDVVSSYPSFASWRMWNLNNGVELKGVEFDPNNRPGVHSFTLDSERATYRLEQTDQYPEAVGELFRTGPATTTWTFTSQPSDAEVPQGYRCPHPLVDQPPRSCQIQPLIQLEYRLGLDVHNQVPAGRAHRFTITAGHHSKAINHAEVTDLSVRASFDDGSTWVDARVIGQPKDTWDTGGLLPSTQPYKDFKVVLMTPPLHRTTGYVTLRVQAEDANGGTVEQTIHRAYILK